MSQERERELVKELRDLRKARRKQKGKILGHPARKQGAAYCQDGHEYLADGDWLAKAKRRIEIFRNAGGEVTFFDESDPFSIDEIRPANCQICVETHLVGWLEGHWHHNCELEKHCDAAACSLYGCRQGHIEHHGRIIRSDRAERAASE